MEIHKGNHWSVSRRDFLVSAGLVAAMSLSVLSDAGANHAAETQFPEGRCGGKMEKKVLVAYASKYGSTGGVADAIGKELCSQQLAADVSLIHHVSDIAPYQGVIVGSAIYRGKWMPEAVDFVERNKGILRQIPVAYFLVCMTLAQPTEKNRAVVLSYMDPVLSGVPEVKPFAVGTFAGAIDYSNLSWPSRRILKSKGTPEGDFRDFKAIHAWAREPLCAEFFHYSSEKCVDAAKQPR